MRKALCRGRPPHLSHCFSYLRTVKRPLLCPTRCLVRHRYFCGTPHASLTSAALQSTCTSTEPSIMASKFVADTASAANPWKAHFNETPFEAESRTTANFGEIESQMPARFSGSDVSFLDKASSLLGTKNPFSKKAKPSDHEIWLLNNTAYKPINGNTGKQEPWQAEFVACFFQKGRKDVTSQVSKIADMIGLDGQLGSDEEFRKRIEERIRPFVMAIAPARTVDITIPSPDGQSSPHQRTLGPSNANGISSQLLFTGGSDAADGSTVSCASKGFPELKNEMHFASPEGWTIVSDIDDTVKKTMTPDPLGVLRTTFAELPQTTQGMPAFYKILHEQFKNPAWFYLSASPYNLYPFLQPFLKQNYPAGTIILRDASWMYFAGLLQSLTEATQEYKTDRLRKIHSWLPKRKVICIGDSTQSDPESYAEIYKEFPGWIKAIYIRKVTDAPFMDQKNKDERFQKAFKDVPEHVWRVFVNPGELENHVKHLTGEAHGA